MVELNKGAFILRHRRVLGSMSMLYAGKTSSILVAFFFLPFYNRLLGPDQFGLVAVILSLQALLMMMDLGMSTLVGREVAVSSSSGWSLFQLVRTAELSISIFYLILLCVALLSSYMDLFTGVSWSVASGTVILFWVLVLQNIYYTAMIGRREYTVASTIQVMGVGVRACVSAYVLYFISATLEAFVLSQLIAAILHWKVSRVFCKKNIFADSDILPKISWPRVPDAIALAKSGSSLILFSAAGAAVLQLDKPLISIFSSAANVAPYYLASLFCLTPIAMLAGPINQYFQPHLLRQSAQGRAVEIRTILKRFIAFIFIFTIIPSCLLWFFRAPIIELWTGGTDNTHIIAGYVEILLPGLAFGALGFIPYSLLIYAKDYRFQAIFSVVMTVITLSLVTIFASKKDIEIICYVYSAYHVFSTVGSWARAMRLKGVKNYARYSAKLTLIFILIFLGVFWLANTALIN